MARREFINTKKAADEVGVSIRTLQQWIKDGKVPVCKMEGSRLSFIDKRVWEEWKARNFKAA